MFAVCEPEIPTRRLEANRFSSQLCKHQLLENCGPCATPKHKLIRSLPNQLDRILRGVKWSLLGCSIVSIVKYPNPSIPNLSLQTLKPVQRNIMISSAQLWNSHPKRRCDSLDARLSNGELIFRCGADDFANVCAWCWGLMHPTT